MRKNIIKISSLNREVICLLKNTSEDVPIETRVEILVDFYHQVELSGYSLEDSRSIDVSGLKGYERIREQVGKEERRLKKFISVIFVPKTKSSELQRRLREIC